MKNSLTDHPTATIYQYKHVKQIRVRFEMMLSYLLSILLLVGVQLYYFGQFGLFALLISFAIIQLLHMLITFVTFIQVEEASDRKWRWSIVPPWIGFKPVIDISYHVFKRVQLHSFWLGIVLISLFYPWTPPSMLLSLYVWHIWLLAPKLLLIMKLNKLHRKAKRGILRIQNTEVNYFQP